MIKRGRVRGVFMSVSAIVTATLLFGCSEAERGLPAGDNDSGAPSSDASVHDAVDSSAEPIDSGVGRTETGSPSLSDATAFDATSDVGAGTVFPDPSTFGCNLFIGVSVTGDWFGAGFETGIDGDRWEAKTQSLAFVENWASPGDAVWAQALTSACAAGATNPDRVIFTGVNWTYTTEAEWESTLSDVVKTIKAKYPGIREIDLMTMLRGPGNKVCGNPGSVEQVVQPYIDQAIAAVAAESPALVRAAPPFYAPSCAVFQPNSPHFADGGAAAVAAVMRDYYRTH